MRWFEAPARTAAPKGHHLHLLRSTAFNPRITYTRIRPPALVAHLFSRTRIFALNSLFSALSLAISADSAAASGSWFSACFFLYLATQPPTVCGTRSKGGGHGRDRALLLQDLANDLLFELIGVLRSRHELILFCRGKKLSPSPEDPTHSNGLPRDAGAQPGRRGGQAGGDGRGRGGVRAADQNRKTRRNKSGEAPPDAEESSACHGHNPLFLLLLFVLFCRARRPGSRRCSAGGWGQGVGEGCTEIGRAHV